MTFDDLNLDSMSSDELWAFWKSLNRVRPIRVARELFPLQPAGYVRAAKDLGNYASNKAVAQDLRLEGKISAAIQYEAIADRIYDCLPAYAKW